MFAGRTLAEAILPVLDDRAAVDLAARRWEAERDAECLPAYHFANAETRVEPQSPVLREIVRGARGGEPDLSDLFGRARTPQQILPPGRVARAFAAALVRGEQPRRETLTRSLRELRTALAVERELRAARFRDSSPVQGSDHPGAEWPAPPHPAPPRTAPPRPAGAERLPVGAPQR